MIDSILHGGSCSSSPLPLSLLFYNENSSWYIALGESTDSTCNSHPIYNFLNYHSYVTPFLFLIYFLHVFYYHYKKNVIETLDNPRWKQAMINESQTLKYTRLSSFTTQAEDYWLDGCTSLKLGQMVRLTP